MKKERYKVDLNRLARLILIILYVVRATTMDKEISRTICYKNELKYSSVIYGDLHRNIMV